MMTVGLKYNFTKDAPADFSAMEEEQVGAYVETECDDVLYVVDPPQVIAVELFVYGHDLRNDVDYKVLYYRAYPPDPEFLREMAPYVRPRRPMSAYLQSLNICNWAL